MTRTGRVAHDVWFDYQKLNTPEHREQFDAGAVGRLTIAGPFALGYQVHVVHHGGEQFASGPVADSFGYGPGLIVERRLAGLDSASLEAFGLLAYDRPDRAAPQRTVGQRAVRSRRGGKTPLAWPSDRVARRRFQSPGRRSELPVEGPQWRTVPRHTRLQRVGPRKTVPAGPWGRP